MSDQKNYLQEELQRLADNANRVRRIPFAGTVRHGQSGYGVSRYYSEAERANAERVEREKPKDILEILAENPKLNATDNYRHQKEEYRQNQENWQIEKQMLAEREAGKLVK
jgi:hypothetical protein